MAQTTEMASIESKPKEKSFLTIKDVIKELGVSRTTFYEMRKRGDIPEPKYQNPKLWLRSDILKSE